MKIKRKNSLPKKKRISKNQEWLLKLIIRQIESSWHDRKLADLKITRNSLLSGANKAG